MLNGGGGVGAFMELLIYEPALITRVEGARGDRCDAAAALPWPFAISPWMAYCHALADWDPRAASRAVP